MTRRLLTALVLAATIVAGCAEAENPQPQAQFPDEGVQATGTLDGRRVAISSGNPDVTAGDCDANDGPDDDLCMVVRSIDGDEVAIVIENPAVLSAGTRVDVRQDGCGGCDEVTSHAVVDIRLNGEQSRVISGSITPSTVGSDQVAADFRFNLSGGNQLVGSFNLVP